MAKNREYHYDEQQGIFVFEDEISVNWLVSQVLQKPGLQITKISNEELQTFLNLLDKSDLRMPDGKHSLFWLRDQLKEKSEMSSAKLGETWHQVTGRFRFIIEQIDMILISTENIKDKMEIRKEEIKLIQNRTPNNMQIKFEPLESV